VDQQDRENAALPRAAERDYPVTVESLERAQNPQVHHCQ
jgi:hypothetical protein